MKGKYYKLRNFFFPRKHIKEVSEIKHFQLQLKLINKEIKLLDNMSQHGILGDALLDRWFALNNAQLFCQKKIAELKDKYHRTIKV